MDAHTEMDAVIRAAGERQQRDLEAGVDVAARLRRFKASADVGWWHELEKNRDRLAAKVASGLLRPVADREAARIFVDRAYRDALDHLPELRRADPEQRERWLYNQTLLRVAEELESRVSRSAFRECT